MSALWPQEPAVRGYVGVQVRRVGRCSFPGYRKGGGVLSRWTPEAVAQAYRRAGQAPPADLGEIKPVSKYNARKKEIDGHVFDSCAEALAYQELKLQEAAGMIAHLELQPRFLLQAGFRDSAGKQWRRIEYVADFKFLRKTGYPFQWVVADVKGVKTPTFRLKEKMFRERFPNINLEIWDTKRKK